MLDWICSKGWTVTLHDGWVEVERKGLIGTYDTVKAAYKALGGS